MDPKRMQFFIRIVDTALKSIQERFKNQNACNNKFEFLSTKYEEMTGEEIEKKIYFLF